MTGDDFINGFREIVNRVHREGGHIRIEVNDKWRQIHFPPGISREFICDRIVQTTEELIKWR